MIDGARNDLPTKYFDIKSFKIANFATPILLHVIWNYTDISTSCWFKLWQYISYFSIANTFSELFKNSIELKLDYCCQMVRIPTKFVVNWQMHHNWTIRNCAFVSCRTLLLDLGSGTKTLCRRVWRAKLASFKTPFELLHIEYG